MFRRHYFMSYIQYHDDGRGSFSFSEAVATERSFLPNPKKVLDQMLDHANQNMKTVKGACKRVHVVAFNRI